MSSRTPCSNSRCNSSFFLELISVSLLELHTLSKGSLA